MATRVALTALLLTALASCGALGCHELTDGTASVFERQLMRNFSHVLRCNGVSGLFAVPYIWRPTSVTVDCGKLQTFQVYVGADPDELLTRYQLGEQAWCSLTSLLKPTCQLHLSPFTTSYVGVRKLFNTGTLCRFAEDDRLSSWMLGSCAAGGLVLALAGPLSESMAFRVTSGGLLFALGSVVILIYVLARQMPGRRSMATTVMLLGSSSWAVLRWLTGHWLPSVYALIHNRWLLAYLAASGLLGAAVTYLYGGVENTKLNTLMRVGLQLLGLVLLYSGTWTMPAVFAVGVAALVGLRALAPLVARFGRRRAGAQAPPRSALPADRQGQQAEWQQQRYAPGPPPSPLPFTPLQPQQYAAAPSASYTPPPFSGGGPLATPGSAAGAAMGLWAAAQAATSASEPPISPLVRAGLIVNPISGRGIKIGGDLYNKLVDQGYVPDLAAGRLQPPPPPTPGSDGGGISSPEGVGRSVSPRRRSRRRSVRAT